MLWTSLEEELKGSPTNGRNYELIADRLERAIIFEHLRKGEQLPTIRHLSKALGVSSATVGAAYKRLQQRGLVHGGVGRGTFVSGISSHRVLSPDTAGTQITQATWRKRALNGSAEYLRVAYPAAVDCSSGRPDPRLLPLELLRTAWIAAVAAMEPDDLQYAGVEPIPQLISALAPHLAIDGVVAESPDLIVANSAQQLMTLALQVVSARTGTATPVVAVEEPGYPTILDTYERAGCRFIGLDVDALGATPSSLESAIAAGARLVLLTPRAHNPTGASWSPERRQNLADVLASHSAIFIVEDDQFAGIASARSGSMISDARLGHRTLYIRSFSKSIAPDLRIAVGVARGHFRSILAEAKSHADGWTSRMTQRVLTNVLASDQLEAHLNAAREEYERRRTTAAAVLDTGLTALGGQVSPSTDGVNLWIRLPPGVEAFSVLESAAALGVVAAPGEPFFVRPGRGDVIRLNAGAVDAEQAARVSQAIVRATSKPVSASSMAIVV